MGSSNPNSFSQQEPNNLETLSSFPPPIQVSSSQVPQYSTQYSDASSSNAASHGEEEASPRPPGLKASKGKAKKSDRTEASEASSMLKFERLWEIKEKDTAARERLSKQRLLESLIAKTNLSEPEVNLKNMLIAEMLG